jgi:HTH-type transcriptional regulator/antitoxin HigA
MRYNWKTLESEREYKEAQKRTIEIFHAEEGSPEEEELDLLLSLVKVYEACHYHIPEPNKI